MFRDAAVESDQAGDRELVERFLATREEAAFRVLYRDHTPYLWALAVRLCRDTNAEAEEVVQEAWVRGIRLLPRFAWGSALRTWLAGILINCWRELRRSSRHWTVDMGTLDVEPKIDPGEGSVDLERALAALSDEHRSVLLLYDREGYSHEEIGALLGIPAGTSKSRLFNARRTLRERLGVSYERER